MTLAASFWETFLPTFTRACAEQGAQVKATWLGSSGEWTAFMLKEQEGVLWQTAQEWARKEAPDRYSVRAEWRKFDLMVVSPKLESNIEWWRTAPILTLEHENGHDIFVEAWNLACWRSALKVLVSYNDNLEASVAITREILQNVDARVGSAGGEFLFLSAPRSFGEGLKWSAYEWIAGDWSRLTPSSV